MILALWGNKKNQSNPRKLLVYFMLIAFTCFSSHFLYFSSLKYLYHYVDVILNFVGHVGFPVYYIYFRLLTIDEKFTLKKHLRFLVPSLVISISYAIGVFLTPTNEYRIWLFNENAFPDSPYIHFLAIMRIITRIFFMTVVAATYIANYLLLKKYGHKAEQYYSDINDGKYNNAKILNYSILLFTVGSFLAILIGRQLIVPKETMIYVLWTIFTVTIYIIGYMGFKQKSINPTYDSFDESEAALNISEQEIIASNDAKQKLQEKLLDLFENKKIYLNSQLNILDIVKVTGTNRTYISSIINQLYNQNFCTYVNSFRIAEMERIILEKPEVTYEYLADVCGFGSISSMKRTIMTQKGLPLNEWKRMITVDRVEV
jgi:AraC-like DNA-binding protein